MNYKAQMPGDAFEAGTAVELSVVLPVYNEKDNLLKVYGELKTALDGIGRSYEILFVDDGSNDGSVNVLEQISTTDGNVRAVQFRRNFGQTAALAAGLDLSRGDVIITLDADLQNDPSDIPDLLGQIDQGADLVCGWRHNRKDGYWLRLIPSKIANAIISMTTDVKLHDYGCTLKAMRREVAENLSLYGEMHRFIPAIASWYGIKIVELKVNHRARTSGVSKYGLSRTYRVILDLLTVKFMLSPSSRPIQLFGSLGLLGGTAGGLLLFWLGIQRIFLGTPLANKSILYLAILLVVVGFQLVTLGLLAELQTRSYHQSNGKPIYVIRKII
jgi:glycosyltransferase involved in cell wall biosynthesis